MGKKKKTQKKKVQRETSEIMAVKVGYRASECYKWENIISPGRMTLPCQCCFAISSRIFPNAAAVEWEKNKKKRTVTLSSPPRSPPSGQTFGLIFNDERPKRKSPLFTLQEIKRQVRLHHRYTLTTSRRLLNVIIFLFFSFSFSSKRWDI